MSQLGNGRVDIFSVLGLFFVIRVCPLSYAVKHGCGFWCVGGTQNYRAIARPEHPPTDIPRNATVHHTIPRARVIHTIHKIASVYVYVVLMVILV